ncbi:MAG: hypothetical protein A2832_02185 [Candidatus Zambryskibacteria bacterium RIFCSPHIGHO2_01_FULL_44_22b]|uniref:SH3b domain-containing protein n=2 Tax=Candidatus Zambryskiibacteriota TaxID=1817925 RepID=A0A1G2SY44_9BACT|nr:MAG: hypothetical protein A2832_02185 [Candidatus Zambryskibacteria bacterium RIFCSPHIGHO2_01_FULL_44_22b]OHB05503.1 MAG: hypothetical protein A3B16_00200 [Candidatus Zambryskibacteria bacterium RIFCSPLOWO2_01_FULL_45_43]
MPKKIIISLAFLLSFGLTSLASANHTTEHAIQELQAQVQALLQQIQNLQRSSQQVPSGSARFLVNDSVVTTSNLRVRPSPSTNTTFTSVSLGARGTIIQGPVSADGRTWWYVDWASASDGWSVGDYLQKTLTPTTQAYSSQQAAVLPPLITVTTPISNEQIVVGTPYRVRWSTTNMPSDAKIGIRVKKEGENTLTTLIPVNSSNNDGVEDITFPILTNPGTYHIFVDAFTPTLCTSSTILCYRGEVTVRVVASATVAETTTTVTNTNTSATTAAGPVAVSLKIGRINSALVDHTDGPLSISSGESVNLSWHISDHQWNYPCTWSGGANGSVYTGDGDRSAGPFTSSQTITFSCNIAGFAVTDSVNVNVASAQVLTAPLDASTTFSPNNGTLTVGQNSWMMSATNLSGGDELWIEAWKDGSHLGKFKICSVPTGFTGCANSGTPTSADLGSWEESVIVKRSGVEYTFNSRGAIRFTVIAPVTTTTVSPNTTASSPTNTTNSTSNTTSSSSTAFPSASMSVSPESVSAGQNITYTWSSAGATSWSWSMIIVNASNGQSANTDGCGTAAGSWGGPPGGRSASGTWTGATSACQAGYTYYIYYRATNANGTAPVPPAVVTVNSSVSQLQGVNFASTIQAMMQTLESISKQLDLLK